MPTYDQETIDRIKAVNRVNTNDRLTKIRDAARELGLNIMADRIEVAINEINGETDKLDSPLP